MTLHAQTKRTLGWLIGAGLVLAIALVIWKWTTSLQGTFEVRDHFVDSTGVDVVSISFVEVEAYDSTHLHAVADLLARTELESSARVDLRSRAFLYHFFIPGDTAALTDEMIDDLAYQHPSIHEPEQRMLYVPGGWVVQVTAPAENERIVQVHRAPFYMPRPGIKAKNLKE